MSKQQFIVNVESVEVKTRDAFGPRYAWQTGERYNVYLNIVGTDQHGKKVYINTPGIEMNVTSAGGVAVVTYYGSNDWVNQGESYCVSDKGADRAVCAASPRVVAGNTISIWGKIKQTYKSGYSLNYVQLIDITK